MITVYGDKLSTEELKGIPVTRPERAGNRWRGVEHYQLAKTIETELHNRDIEITKCDWTLARNEQALFGGMALRFPSGLAVDELEGMDYALGIRHANDMTTSLQFFAGVTVQICSNGIATGQLSLQRKHSCGMNLSDEVAGGIDRMIEEARRAGDVVNQMRERRLSQRAVDHHLCEAGRQRLLSWGHLGLVEKEYRRPTHVEFTDKTAYSLYNAYNHIVKRISPARQLTALDGFRQLILN